MKKILAILIISVIFYKVSANPVKKNITQEEQIESSINLLLERIKSNEPLKPEDYLIDFSPVEETVGGNLTEGKEYGGNRFFSGDNDAKRLTLIQSLSEFNTLYNNTTNSNGQTQIFAFVGRYYLGYRKNRQGVDGIGTIDNKAKETKILNALADRLNSESEIKINNPKRFEQDWIGMLDDKYKNYERVANVTTINGKKVILFFYIEFVMSESSYNPDYDAVKDEIKPNIKVFKHKVSGIWHSGLDPFQWAQFNLKDDRALGFFSKQLIFDNITGLQNPEGFTACTNKIKELYGSPFDLNDRSVIATLMNSMPCEKVKEITFATRKTLLQKLENGILSDLLISDANSKELAVLKLLDCTPSSQIDDLLNWLYQTNGIANSNKKLLNSFFEKLDGSNHPRYISSITNLLYKSNSVGNATEHMITDNNADKRFIYVSDDSYFSKQFNGKQECEAEFIANNANIKYNLKVMTDVSHLVYNTYGGLSYGGSVGVTPPKYEFIVGSDIYKETLHPYDWVYVFDESNLGLTDDKVNYVEDESGKLGKVVPAIYLVYASNERFKSNTIQAVALAADVLTIATGPGAILKAYRGGQIAIALYEAAQLAGSALNVVVNVIPPTDPATKEMIDEYNAIIGLIGLKDLPAGGVALYKGCVSSIKKVKQLPITKVASWRAAFKATQESIKTLPADIQIKLTKLDNYLNAKGVSAVNLLTDFEQRVADIGHTFSRAKSEIKTKVGNKLLATVSGKKIKFEEAESVFGVPPTNGSKKFYDITEVEVDGITVSADNMQMWDEAGKLGYNCTGVFCFTENTPLETGELLIEKNVGDLLETTNPNTGQRVFAKIEKIKRGFARTLTHLLIAGQTLSLTPAHALQTNDGLWVQAGKIQGGEKLISPNGIVTVDDVCTEEVSGIPVISYELENDLPYFVGKVPVLASGTCNLRTIKSFLSKVEWDALILLVKNSDLNTAERAIFFGELVAGNSALRTLLRSEEGLKGWKAFYNFPNLRIDATQLQKFKNLVTNNNLGLSAEDIAKLIDSRTASRGLQWEHPEELLSAIERASVANISGTKISIKGFPTPEDGSVSFTLSNAKQYQLEASGDALLSFDITTGSFSASFDNINSSGKLIDRKWGHSGIFEKNAATGAITIKNQDRVNSALAQAQRQVDAANGKPIRWEISTELGADGLRQSFQNAADSRIRSIEVVWIPQITIIN